jgi:hypothetical protein
VPRAPGDASSLGHRTVGEGTARLREPEPLALDRRAFSAKGAAADDNSSSNHSSRWRHVLFSKTVAAVRQSAEQHRGYLDRKYVLQSPPGATTLEGQGGRGSSGGGGQRLTLRLPRNDVRSSSSSSSSSSSANGSLGSEARRFVSLCFPWTGQHPDSWAPLGPASCRVWIDGVQVAPATALRFATADEAAPLSDGPCATIFLGDLPYRAQRKVRHHSASSSSSSLSSRSSGSASSSGNGVSSSATSGSDGGSAYTVEIEPTTPNTHITLSHVVWR